MDFIESFFHFLEMLYVLGFGNMQPGVIEFMCFAANRKSVNH